MGDEHSWKWNRSGRRCEYERRGAGEGYTSLTNLLTGELHSRWAQLTSK